MSEAKPKLTYFGLHAKAECIRMVCAKGNIDYEDNRITFEEFGALKASGALPSGQVPLWTTTDGKDLNQAFAILRMLGRQTGHYNDQNVEECFIVDWALETALDHWGT